MILNIVKNGTDSSSILECVKKTFNSSKVNIKTDYEISVDIEVIGEGGLHSLEDKKEYDDWTQICFSMQNAVQAAANIWGISSDEQINKPLLQKWFSSNFQISNSLT